MKKLLSLTIAIFLSGLVIDANVYGQLENVKTSEPVYIENGASDFINYCQYRTDNITLQTAWKNPYEEEVLWMNYYEEASLCQIIARIEVYFHGNWVLSGGPFKVILYDDPDDDGNPDDAVYLTETSGLTVSGFNTLDITPTEVDGGFFAAILYQGDMSIQGWNFPVSIDNSGVIPGNGWWVFGDALNINDLTSNPPEPFTNTDGAFLIRAYGQQEVQPTPLSDYAIYFGIFLIIAFTAIRLRRSFF